MFTVAIDGLRNVERPGGAAVASAAVAPSTATVSPTKLSACVACAVLLQRNQRGELVVRLELLLDLRELHELLGELVGVERVERILVLELRGQQLQEGLEVAGDGLAIDADRAGLRGRGRQRLMAAVTWVGCREGCWWPLCAP